MKALCLLSVLAIAALDGRSEFVFRGVMKIGVDRKYCLTESVNEKLNGWYKVNDKIGDYTIKEYIEKDESLVLDAGGKLLKLKLLDAKAKPMDSAVAQKGETPSEIQDTTVEGLAKRGLYRIERGDTGLKVAMKHGVSIGELAALNPGVVWSRLKVGQIVRYKKE